MLLVTVCSAIERHGILFVIVDRTSNRSTPSGAYMYIP